MQQSISFYKKKKHKTKNVELMALIKGVVAEWFKSVVFNPVILVRIPSATKNLIITLLP
jgi:hypothetical protein